MRLRLCCGLRTADVLSSDTEQSKKEPQPCAEVVEGCRGGCAGVVWDEVDGRRWVGQRWWQSARGCGLWEETGGLEC